MTDLELLDLLGSVKNEYILQAQALRAQDHPTRPRRTRKPLLLPLLAATLALAALLAARVLLR